MLDLERFYTEDYELYSSCTNIAELTKLSRIIDYIRVLKKEKNVSNTLIDGFVVDCVAAIEVPFNEAFKKYNNLIENKSELKGQIYIVTIDSIGYIMQEWELTFGAYLRTKDSSYRMNLSKALEYWNGIGTVTTLAEGYTKVKKRNRVRCSNGNVFDSIVDAATWCVDHGLSKGNAATYIQRSIGKNTKAYGYFWYLEPVETALDDNTVFYSLEYLF